MVYYVVDISGFPDDVLALFGWINVGGVGGFTKYWCPRYNEYQTVSNTHPRTLILDDMNDVQQMGATIVMTFRYP